MDNATKIRLAAQGILPQKTITEVKRNGEA